MRILLWLTVGFGAACALGIYLLPVWLLLLFGGGLLATAGLLFAFTRKYPALRRVQLIFLGFFLAAVWYGVYDAVILAPVKSLDGNTIETEIRVTDYSYETDYGIAAEGQIHLDGRKYRVKFYLNDPESALRPGDTVAGNFRMRYTGFGGSEDPTYHSADRIFLLAYPRGEPVSQENFQQSLRDLPANLRQYLLKSIETLFPEDVAGFVKALMMGETSELSYTTDTALTVSGIRHIAAVSGLHVSILFSLIFFLTGKQGKLSVLIGLPLLLLFAAMAGFSPSVNRACLMQGLMLLSILLHKEYDPPAALSFAVLVMLVANPVVITSVGFQLSVASVSGIFLFTARITGWLLDERRLGKWKKKRGYGLVIKFSTSIGVSLGAMVLTTPLTAWYFGNVSISGVLTNLLCLWLVTGIFCGSIAACLLGAAWLPLGKIAACVVAWVVRLVVAIAGAVAQLPVSAVYTQSIYIIAWLVFCYVLLAVFLLARERQTLLLLGCAVVGLCIAMLASWSEPLLDNYRVTVLDVGQGQCVLLQSEGKTYMVDCGSDYSKNAANKAAATLLSQGVTKLDGLILTHYDEDHVGGAAMLLSRIPADLLVLPEGTGAEEFESDILAVCNGTVLRGDEDLRIAWGDAWIRVYASFDTETTNESSLCVLFHTEKCDILITGDRSMVGESFLLRTAQLPKLDALIVGHHGSANSTGEALLAATRPATAVISVGEGNRYGHPAQEVLDRLTAYGCTIRRTDLEGTIVLRG